MNPLNAALVHLKEAERIIGEVWAAHPEVRISRLADCVSLLDRGRSKLEKEAARPWPPEPLPAPKPKHW